MQEMQETIATWPETIKILITDRIAQEGIDLLRTHLPRVQIDERPGLKPHQLQAIIGNYTALIVRSETQVTKDVLAAAQHLKIVGRAGVGVDNIDTEAATRQGIMAVNSPTGYIIAAAEHTITLLLLALARHIPGANASMKTGRWEKNRFLGVEDGNRNVILCERGIRTFEKITRNTMDISAIPPIKRLSHLPIISDPSQGTGRRDLVVPMSLTSIAAGTDGLLIEVHPHPDQALKDGAQSLTLQQFERLMPQAQAVGAAVGRDFILSEMDAHLPSSACLDASLYRLGGQQSYETALTDPARRTER
jgi:D-3-phosphoglycerate dehydrogenase / 2-oxoglutarate reductase